MLRDTSKTTIRHLHLVASQGDPLLLRLRAESQFNAASLTVPGLPAAAILLVRQLKTPPLDLQSAALPSQAWQNAARSNLADLARRAARPISAPASPDSPAVLFADYAELLACLALDLATNRAAGCWWWRSFLGEVSLPAALHAWVEHAREAPSALNLLHLRAQAVPFLRLTPTSFAENLGRAIQFAFNLTHLDFIFDGNATSPGLTPMPIPSPGELPASVPVPGDSSFPQSVTVEQAFYAPESIPEGLSHAHWALLNLARIVHHSPSVLAGVTSTENVYEKLLIFARSQNVNSSEKISFPEQKNLPKDEVSSERKISQEKQYQENQALAAVGETAPKIKSSENLPLARIVETKYGGIFYLLNVAIALELYGDFSMPVHKGLDLSPWDFLALLGMEFIGEAFTKDPLWQLLADLAGREGDDNLAVRRALFSGIFAGEEFARLPSAVPGVGCDALTGLVSAIRARLLAAFAETDFDKLVHLLFHEPACIFVSAARLDVNFSLETHPIEIRVAGLDRDIGWLPAAGMAIFYHYE